MTDLLPTFPYHVRYDNGLIGFQMPGNDAPIFTNQDTYCNLLETFGFAQRSRASDGAGEGV